MEGIGGIEREVSKLRAANVGDDKLLSRIQM